MIDDQLFKAALIAVAAAALAYGFVPALGPRWREPGRALKIAGQVGLGVWFAYWSWQTIASFFEQFPLHMDMIGFDARIYLHAAQTWLAGGDPWTAYADRHAWGEGAGYLRLYFAGPPPTVLAFVPFAWLSDDAMTTGWMALTIGSAFYSLRRLGLPAWWILFPPLTLGVFVGNPHIVCLALLLCGSSWLRALAAPMKAYALIPMVGERQWKALGILAVAGTISVVVFWPLWMTYRADFSHVQAWMQDATWGGFSAARDPRLFAVTAGALGVLALIDRRGAAWLAVPALWPASEFFYSTFALPLRSPWLVAVLAVPGTQFDARVPWAIVSYATVRIILWLVAAVRSRRTARLAPTSPELA
jgi:hypothetical protein